VGQVTALVTLRNAREVVLASLGHLAPERIHTYTAEALIDTGTRPAVAERGAGATRRWRGGRKGALFFLSVGRHRGSWPEVLTTDLEAGKAPRTAAASTA
jgi:hypothetical protein